MKKIAYMMVALAMVAAPMAFAESIFQLDGNIKTSGDWSTGFPIDDVGTIATNGVLGNGNLNTSTWGTYTINHTAGTLTGTGNHNIYNNANGTYNQSGGSVSVGAGVFANQLTYNLSAAGTIQAANVEATNGGTFNQTGGSFTSIGATRMYRVNNNGIVNLTGGTAVSTTAGSAFDLLSGAINVGGDFDMVIGGTVLYGSAPLTFATDWAGSFTRDDYTAAEWQADLVAGTVKVGITEITDANFDTWFSVANAGAVGSMLTVIPEPATLGLVAAFGGCVLFIRRRLMM